jgi:hypothetical protein
VGPARCRQAQRHTTLLGRRPLRVHARRARDRELGKTLYRQRQETVEPVFANTTFNRRFDRFQRRGRAACHSDWRLITATHNLLKLHTALHAA